MHIHRFCGRPKILFSRELGNNIKTKREQRPACAKTPCYAKGCASGADGVGGETQNTQNYTAINFLIIRMN